MKDLGILEFVLGTEVKQNRANKTISMSQKRYINDMLSKFKLLDCKAAITPMCPKSKLSKSTCPKSDAEKAAMAKTPYREAVGSLLWVSNGTRPDIAYAVSQVAKYMTNPGQDHWTAVKRIMRYLKGTSELEIVYNGYRDIETSGYFCGVLPTPTLTNTGSITDHMVKRPRVIPDFYVDADYANDPESRRSITGYVFLLAGAPISWQSRQQVSVALSSMEAEYMAACAAAQEALWLRMLLADLGVDIVKPISLKEDNQAAIAFSKNPGDHKRSKHIDIRYHFVREKVASGEFTLDYISTDRQLADIFTKALDVTI